MAAALAGLSSAQQQTLLNALLQVKVQTVKEWLTTGLLQEWVKQGLHIQNEKGESQATAFFALAATLLQRCLTRGLSVARRRAHVIVQRRRHSHCDAMIPDDTSSP